jgi:hypothetical protein
LPTTTDTLVGKTTTDTLTNKTLTSPVIAGTPTGVGVLTAGTAVTASGTSVDFTSIPSWVKRIAVMFAGVSTNGTSNYLIQLGSGSITTSGYLGGSSISNNLNQTAAANFTTGFGFTAGLSAAAINHGIAQICLLNSNSWTMSCSIGRSDAAVAGSSGGSVSLSGTLDRIRVTTVNGTDAFDAGSINILFE